MKIKLIIRDEDRARFNELMSKWGQPRESPIEVVEPAPVISLDDYRKSRTRKAETDPE